MKTLNEMQHDMQRIYDNYGACNAYCVTELIAYVLQNHLGGDALEIVEEVKAAKEAWPPFNSAHEGFAVLNEEFDELKEHVWTNQKRRDLPAMRKEAKQVAAMALRFMTEVCDEERGRK